MRRASGLTVVSRRDFCRIGLGIGGLTLAEGCTDGGLGGVQTGPLGGGDDDGSNTGTPPDAPPQVTPDAPPSGPACTTSALDVGPASSFVNGTPKYFSSGSLFVVRDSGGLYALTARCTHQGVTCSVSSGRFRCPAHGALFNFDGSIISGPVSQPLRHYAMCILSNGNVGVITSQTVSASDRLVV